jgi:hypothetical protein
MEEIDHLKQTINELKHVNKEQAKHLDVSEKERQGIMGKLRHLQDQMENDEQLKLLQNENVNL